jgi:hypothetical protein
MESDLFFLRREIGIGSVRNSQRFSLLTYRTHGRLGILGLQEKEDRQMART